MNSVAHTGQVLEAEQMAALDGAMAIFLLSRCDGICIQQQGSSALLGYIAVPPSLEVYLQKYFVAAK